LSFEEEDLTGGNGENRDL